MSKCSIFSALLLISFLAAPLAAEPLVLTQPVPATYSMFGIAPPIQWKFIFKYDESSTEIASATVTGIVPSFDPAVWSIDATNAVDFGLDWGSLVEWASHPISKQNLPVDPVITWAYGPYGSGDGSFPAHSLNLDFDEQLIDFAPARLELEVSFWALNQSSIIWRLYGDGVIVPEPATFYLCLIGLATIPNHRRRRCSLPLSATVRLDKSV